MRERIICAAIIAATLSSVSLDASSESAPNVSPPSNIAVSMEPPGSNVPPGLAAFAGKWGGYWDGTLPSNLIVESVDETGQVHVVYVWGTDSRVPNPGAAKIRAKIVNGKLSWGDPTNGVGFEFKLRPDGKLDGERYNHGSQQGAVTMTKM